jgi:hypothetical protein
MQVVMTMKRKLIVSRLKQNLKQVADVLQAVAKEEAVAVRVAEQVVLARDVVHKVAAVVVRADQEEEDKKVKSKTVRQVYQPCIYFLLLNRSNIF